jgi:hypothetical protein
LRNYKLWLFESAKIMNPECQIFENFHEVVTKILFVT